MFLPLREAELSRVSATLWQPMDPAIPETSTVGLLSNMNWSILSLLDWFLLCFAIHSSRVLANTTTSQSGWGNNTRPSTSKYVTGKGPQAGSTYLVFYGSFLDGTHPVASVLLTQPADKADGLPMVFTEEQLHLFQMALAVWYWLWAQASGAILCK